LRPLLLILIAVLAACRTAPPPPHPLAPLSALEIREAAEILKPRVPASAHFSLITLDEPPKEMVLRSIATPRRAAAVIYDADSNTTWEAIANLSAHRVDRLQPVPGAQPLVTGDDSARADQIVRSDPRWRAAIEARGIHDFSNVSIVAWTAGYFALPGTEQGRVVRAIPYYSAGNTRNYFAHPIEGVVAHVNLTTGTILDLLDTGRDVPVPREPGELGPLFNTPLRLLPAPLSITQTSGPGFRLENGEVRWEKWRFRFALHPREGLVLYTVGYEDGGRVRPILYRGSLSEMVVPYGDPSGGWFFRNSFDAGELGLGLNASQLRAGADCPQNCTLYDAVVSDAEGRPVALPRAIALYERDGGIAWKHDDETRRARDLVLGFVSTVGNYDYAFDWIFHQDGSLEMHVGLTGVMAAKAILPGSHDPYSHAVAPGLAAPHHQHFFTFRLDMDVDGALPNRVAEMNSVPVPGGVENPYGGAFQMVETPLLKESEAQRALDLSTSRKWIVTNSAVRNALGHPTGYALLPGENAVPFAQPESWVRRRARFLDSHIWVTPYRAREMYAGGEYPNQSRGDDGLARWTAADRTIQDRDVVLWYTMGITHNPRPEDWPVMPVHSAGFKLVPWGFFGRNPAMDLPRE
jgi:primary-amine oxidase